MAKSPATSGKPTSEKPEHAAPPAAKTNEEVGLSAAIRKAIETVGRPVDRETTAAIRTWISNTYPSLKEKVTSATFSSTLAQIKKSMGMTGTRATSSKPRTYTSDVVTLAEGFQALAFANSEFGGLKQTAELLKKIEPIVEQYGDLSRFKEILHTVAVGMNDTASAELLKTVAPEPEKTTEEPSA